MYRVNTCQSPVAIENCKCFNFERFIRSLQSLKVHCFSICIGTGTVNHNCDFIMETQESNCQPSYYLTAPYCRSESLSCALHRVG